MKAHQLGVDVAGLHAPEIARQSGQCAGQREGGEFVAKGAKTQCAHAVLVDANARQRPPKRAPEQAAQKEINQQQGAQGEVVQRGFVVQVNKRQAAQRDAGAKVDVQAVGAAQGLVVKEQEEHHLCKRHGDHDEVDAVGAHHKKANHQGCQARAQHRQGQGGPQGGGFVLRH